jgi:hypothetical protein
MIEDGVAQLYVTMEDFVNAEMKFYEVQDVVSHIDEIIEVLTKKGYQVEIEQMPETKLGALKRSYDTWYKMIYG